MVHEEMSMSVLFEKLKSVRMSERDEKYKLGLLT